MAFTQGLGGLSAAAENLNVLGKNIANSTTVGYKSESIDFTNVLSGHLNSANSGSPSQTGGSALASNITQSFAQGPINNTTAPLNAAIEGQGLFVMKDPVLGRTVYTRNGQFMENSAGLLVNGSGYQVLSSAGTSIQLPVAPNDVRPGSANTNQIDVVGFNEELSPFGSVTFGGLTYTNSDGTTLSASDVASIFTNLSAGATSNPKITSGTFTGALGNYNTTQDTDNIPQTYLGQDISQMKNVSWIQATATGYGPQPTITVNAIGLLSGTNLMVATHAPGTVVAHLNTMAIDQTGTIIGTYSDGLTSVLGQIGVASVPSYTGLKAVGNNTWMQSAKSGAPIIGTAQEIGSTVQGSALEGSNENQTTDMVALLAAQQAYQANAQSIKIEDQMFQTVIAMNG